MRVLFALVSGIVISIALFFGMHLLISNDANAFEDKKDIPHLVYLSEEKETKLERKKRVKPIEPSKKPPPKKIKLIEVNKVPKFNQNIKVQTMNVNIPKVANISAISSLNGAQVAVPMQSTYDAYSLQSLKRVHPKYPRRAKLQRKEGYVDLGFVVTKDGEVSNIVVVDSDPKGVFEDASIDAIKQWKFKANNENINASIKFNFRLAR